MGVATAIAIGGLAISAASTTSSFIQAGQEKKKQREAEAKAAEAMAEARKKLEVNFSENLSIQKEPYELEREALLSQGALSLQAGVESDRGAEATAGRIQMAQNAAQAGVRGSMGQEMMNIEQKIIDEDSRLRDIGVELDLGEAEGAQLAAKDAEKARAAAITQGFEGLGSTASMALDMVPLFQKTSGARQTQKLSDAASKQNISQADFQKNITALSADPQFNYLSGLGAKDVDFNAFMSGLSRDRIRAIGKKLKIEGY